jgi:hypothetical protein
LTRLALQTGLQLHETSVSGRNRGQTSVERDQPDIQPTSENQIRGVVRSQRVAQLPYLGGELDHGIGERSQIT